MMDNDLYRYIDGKLSVQNDSIPDSDKLWNLKLKWTHGDNYSNLSPEWVNHIPMSKIRDDMVEIAKMKIHGWIVIQRETDKHFSLCEIAAFRTGARRIHFADLVVQSYDDIIIP
jgi:hypothetical protein